MAGYLKGAPLKGAPLKDADHRCLRDRTGRQVVFQRDDQLRESCWLDASRCRQKGCQREYPKGGRLGEGLQVHLKAVHWERGSRQKEQEHLSFS
jgi:hypothetical protein